MLHRWGIVGDGVENVKLVVGPDHSALLVPPEMVNCCIVGNPHHPRTKLSCFYILSRFEDLHHLDPSVLEEVVGEGRVDELRRENAALIRREEEHMLLILDMETKIDQLMGIIAELQNNA